MKNLKVETSTSYRENLISSLQDSEHAAAYMAVMLELDEDGYDPKVVSYAFKNIVDARKNSGDFSESAQHHHQQLDKILNETGGAEILKLIEFLDALGYRISIVPKD
jgi:DNA-binding phage protein